MICTPPAALEAHTTLDMEREGAGGGAGSRPKRPGRLGDAAKLGEGGNGLKLTDLHRHTDWAMRPSSLKAAEAMRRIRASSRLACRCSLTWAHGGHRHIR